jgi:hypothetical protein
VTAPVGQGTLPGVHDEPEGQHGRLTTIDAVRAYVYAGHATFTVVSKRTGERRTLRCRRAPTRPTDPEDRAPGYFVDTLVGPDNDHDFRYLGFVIETTGTWDVRFKMNRDNWGAEAWRVARWFFSNLQWKDAKLLEQAEVWHRGRCGRCGRTLTVPESIASGLGPVCAAKEE